MADTAAVTITRIAVERMLVPIVGTSPLVVHKFSEKAKRQMLDAQQGRKSPKVARDPDADYQNLQTTVGASGCRGDDSDRGTRGGAS